MHQKFSTLLIIFIVVTLFAQSSWKSPFLKSESPQKPVLKPTASIHVVKQRPVHVLITRPVTKFGDAPLENKWLLLLCESYIYFRLSSLEGVQVITQQEISRYLPEYSAYLKPIALEKYVETAIKMDVPYVVYVQCEYSRFASSNQVSLGASLNFFGKLFTPGNETPVLVDARQFNLDKIGIRLDSFLEQIIDTVKIQVTDKNRNFLQTPVISSREKVIRKVSDALAEMYEVDSLTWNTFFKKYKRLLKRDSDMLLGYYAGARVCEDLHHYKEAAELFQSLMDILDTSYPLAFVETSRLYRMAGNFQQALRIIESVPEVESLKLDIKMEKAFLYDQMGALRKAADIALEVLKEDNDNIKARQFFAQDSAQPVDSLIRANE